MYAAVKGSVPCFLGRIRRFFAWENAGDWPLRGILRRSSERVGKARFWEILPSGLENRLCGPNFFLRVQKCVPQRLGGEKGVWW